jgi:hypothetical protein
VGNDPKSTAKAILGMGPKPSAEDGEPLSGEVEIDAEDAAINAAADEAFEAVRANDAEAFRSAFKTAIRAAMG